MKKSSNESNFQSKNLALLTLPTKFIQIYYLSTSFKILKFYKLKQWIKYDTFNSDNSQI